MSGVRPAVQRAHQGQTANRLGHKSEQNIAFVAVGVQDINTTVSGKLQHSAGTYEIGSGPHAKTFKRKTFPAGFRFKGFFPNARVADAGNDGPQSKFYLLFDERQEHDFRSIEATAVNDMKYAE